MIKLPQPITELRTIEHLYILVNLKLKAQPINTMYTWLEDAIYNLIDIGYVMIEHNHYIITVNGLNYLQAQIEKIEIIAGIET